jgi:hypothetical protein
MPVDPNAPVRISAFNWVPPFAQGQVRDLRPRWALEEAGIAYAVRKLDAMAERPADYYGEQPFGQVPSYRDGNVLLFESGAIVLHIGRDCETLLPADPAARARATAWLIAALNSVEPYVMQLATIDVFAAGEEWAKLRRPGVIEMCICRPPTAASCCPAATPSPNPDSNRHRLAGFAIQADPLLLEILPEAVEILDCRVPGCRTGCPARVLTGDLSEDDADGLDRLAALKRTRRLAVNAARRPEDHAHPMAHLVADALDVISGDSVTLTRSCYAWLYLCLPTMHPNVVPMKTTEPSD